MTVESRGEPPWPSALVLSVDDVGELVLLMGSSVGVGHVGSREADLAFLGDIDPLHATLELAESFHGGAQWRLNVLPGHGSVKVDGREVPGGSSCALHDGDEVRFGEAATFILRRSDPSSVTVVLELSGRTEAFGARRVVLMGSGQAGRLRIGPRKRRQLPVLGTNHDVSLVLRSEGIEISCSAGVKEALPGAARLSDSPGALVVPLPVAKRRDFHTGAALHRMPPFGLALRPLVRPPERPVGPGA